MYKIIAIDADGTLLDDTSRIPEENKAALLRAQEKGVRVAIASGRGIPTLAGFANELGLDPERSHIIALNGAAVFDGYKNQIREIRMKKSLMLYILEKVLPLGMLTIVYHEADAIYVKLPADGDRTGYADYYRLSHVHTIFTDDFDKDINREVYKVLVIGDGEKLRQLEMAMEPEKHRVGFEMFFSGKRLLEFTSTASTKARALDFICRRLNIDMTAESIAIGDSFNDLCMIQSAALGVCMKNGREPVKQAADYVTERDNNNGGVAEVVEKFI
ncbi:MAG: Cof-type HAD-IIB family hydrolase [Defluviitaleaceae bacterium]|nr:Cof-type HAD-IIB family hydrolase [Defluviitaleaceae bacterium]MCL2836473.1 Cof-type HAD-IIB family hydrolase [Defluviitaleaceae bacterium]